REMMNETLKYSAIFGIIAGVTGILPDIISWGDNQIVSSLNHLIYVISSIIYIWGYKIVGEKTHNNLLKYTAIAYIPWLIITAMLFLSPTFFNAPHVILWISTFGILGILFGIALLKLAEVVGSIAKVAGVLGILSGICFVTVKFAIIGRLLGLPAYVLGIMILFKAANMEQFK
ncbi:MAG: hypothetical protein JSW40_04435, partial [Candidatus Omnitrophota bacterium]